MALVAEEFVEFSDLTQLTADLRAVVLDTGVELVKAVEVTAHNVRDSWRDKLKGSETVPRGAASVTYDMTAGDAPVGALPGSTAAKEIGAEIGPELGRAQGPIVGMLEYGTPTTGPRGFGLESLRENEEDFERGVALAAEASMRRKNL